MTDEMAPNPIKAKERLSTPELTVFDKLVKVMQESKTFGFPRKDMDRIYRFWHGMNEFAAKVNRLEESLDLTRIPEAEIEQAREVLLSLVTVVEPIAELLRKFDQKDISQCSWKEDGKPISRAIKEYEETQDEIGYYEDSVTALLEAISESEQVGQLSEAEMRQKIAQHAIEELWTSFDYARLNYAAEVDDTPSTIDGIEEEKEEFISALRGELWTDDQAETHKGKIRALVNAVKDIVWWDEEILTDHIKIVWRAARGKAEKDTTAIDVFIAVEEILKSLNEEGAFEWDPDDELIDYEYDFEDD